MFIVEAIKNIGEKFFRKDFEDIRSNVEIEISKDPKSSYEYIKYLNSIGQMPVLKNLNKLTKSAESYDYKEIPYGLLQYQVGHPEDQTRNPEEEAYENLEREFEEKEKKDNTNFGEYSKDSVVAEIMDKSSTFLYSKITEDIINDFISHIVLSVASNISSRYSFIEKNENIKDFLVSEINPFIEYEEKDIDKFNKFFAGIKDDQKREIIFDKIWTISSGIILGKMESYRYFLVFLQNKYPEIESDFFRKIGILLDGILKPIVNRIKNSKDKKWGISDYNKFIRYLIERLPKSDIPKINEMNDDIKKFLITEKIENINESELRDKILLALYSYFVYKIYSNIINSLTKNDIKFFILNKLIKTHNLGFVNREYIKSKIENTSFPVDVDFDKIIENMDLKDENSAKYFLKLLVIALFEVDKEGIILFMETVGKKNKTISINLDENWIKKVTLNFLNQEKPSIDDCYLYLKKLSNLYNQLGNVGFFKNLIEMVVDGMFMYGKKENPPIPFALALLVDKEFKEFIPAIKNFNYYINKAINNMDKYYMILKRIIGDYE